MKKIKWNKGWKFGRQESENREEILIPHDAMIHEKRDSEAEGGSAQAYFYGGKYVYEKTFSADKDMIASHGELEFEGVYKDAEVFINGEKAGGTAYGYGNFFVNLDGKIKEGDNTVKVLCDNSAQPDSRWYSGAGIYRPVWMWTGAENCILPQGIRVVTKDPNLAEIEVSVKLFKEAAKVSTIRISIFDGEEKLAESSSVVNEKGTGATSLILLPDVEKWSAENPKLYRCSAELIEAEEVVDVADINFGIRKITWDSTGLYINGKSILLRGGCVHHDNGVLGAATFDEAEWRRVRILKEAGFNAIRSAHNPASRAMLDACDALGIYVMDETWDMWFNHKSKYDYASKWEANYKDDIRALVARDFNHPSVIMYSIGNEVSEPVSEEGLNKEKEMVKLLHRIDPGRPVTGGFNLMIMTSAARGKSIYKEDGGLNESGENKMQGMNSTMFNLITSVVGTGMNKSANSKKADKVTSPALDGLDIAGYNYASGRYSMDGNIHPKRLIVGSETFPQDIWKNWKMVEKYPYLTGDFMWTSWDYIGEAGIGAWAYTDDGRGFNKPYPWLLAEAGAIDILGNPGGELFLAQAAWKIGKAPGIAVRPVNHADKKPAKAVWRGTNSIPSWSFRGCDGKNAYIEVFTWEDEIALYFNGRKIDQKAAKNGVAVFRIKYKSGELKAVAIGEDGEVTGVSVLKSAKGELHACPLPEKKVVEVGSIAFVPVCVMDKDGVTDSNSDRKLTVTVDGGKLLGFGSAAPRTEERFDQGQYTTYYGKALAVVYAEHEGRIKVTVDDNGHMETANIEVIQSNKKGKRLS